MLKQAFPPIINSASRVLVLGSMPGEISLQHQQYYAHPRNAFWWIMNQLLAIDPGAPYDERIAQLAAANIALWDVLHRCRRQGSLDSAIEADSVEANPFPDFLARYPNLCAIFFNGKSVANLYQRHVTRAMAYRTAVPTHTLPSTSPANARLRPADKLTAWRQISAYL